MNLLAAITQGADAFLAFTVLVIVMFVLLLFTIDR